MRTKDDDDDPPIGPPTYTGKTIKIRQVRSRIGTRREHREILKSLGLRRIRHEVERPDTPSVRGMLAKIGYLLEVIETGAREPAAKKAAAKKTAKKVQS